jgi:hypothetical protein
MQTRSPFQPVPALRDSLTGNCRFRSGTLRPAGEPDRAGQRARVLFIAGSQERAKLA